MSFATVQSTIAQVLWDECLFICESIEINIEINFWTDVFLLLDCDYTNFDINRVIQLNILLHTIDSIYKMYKMITDKHTNKDINDTFIDNVIDIAKAQVTILV